MDTTPNDRADAALHAYQSRARRNAEGALQPLVPIFASCVGCGTEVAPGEQFCATCAEKPVFQAPKPMLVLDAQPVPVQERPEYTGQFPNRRPVETPAADVPFTGGDGNGE